MENKQLTLVIATYNRRDSLLRQLHSIYNQKQSKEVDIVICDNHSDYNVQEEIITEFGELQTKNLTIIQNERNLGMGPNLALMLLKSKTPWFWTLSDDDVTTDNSISEVLSQINEHGNCDAFIFSIQGFPSHDNMEVNTLETLIDYYAESKHPSGDFLFLSNKVYKKQLIDRYFGDALEKSSTLIPHLFPLINGLDNKDAIVFLSPKVIIEFKHYDKEQGWNALQGALGLSNMIFYTKSLDIQYRKRLITALMGNFSHISIIEHALRKNDRKYGKMLYKRIYNYSFKYFKGVKYKLMNITFYISYYFHISPQRLYKLGKALYG